MLNDFHFHVDILRDQMVDALCENPEQLAYVLMELADKLPGTWAYEDLMQHLQDQPESNAALPKAAMFYKLIANRLEGATT